MHVLVIDDDLQACAGTARVLGRIGYFVTSVHAGEDGLRIMRQGGVDVVVLDINLGPGKMNGWDVAREKLLDPTIRAIPVVVLSGMTADEIRDGARVTTDALAGTMLIMSKPTSMDALAKALALIKADHNL